MSDVHMLTTLDNPYDPFTQFNLWYSWDEQAGYCTSGLLARVLKSSDDLSMADQDLAIEQAMQEIVDINVSGMHRLVTEP